MPSCGTALSLRYFERFLVGARLDRYLLGGAARSARLSPAVFCKANPKARMQTTRKTTFSTLVLAALGLMCGAALAHAQAITATWNPNPSSEGVTGYEVCLGTSPLTCSVALRAVSSSETSYAFTPARGVLHYVAVRATNQHGVSPYSGEATFSIPALAPPANQNSALGVTIPSFALAASDPDGSRLTYSATGLPLGLAISATSGRIDGTPTSPGTYTVTVSVTDGFRPDTASFSWAIGDAAAPSLSITSHATGTTVSSTTVTISGTATDSGTGNSGILGVTVNGNATSGGTATGEGTAHWSSTLTLPSTGSHAITARAEDGGGNVRTAQITLTVATSGGGGSSDTTPPLVTIGSHTNGHTVTTTTITVSGTASDRNLGGNGVASVRVNGQLASGGTANRGQTAKWSWALTLVKGPNVVTVSAADKVGNVRTVQITINVTT
jgi:hypothetical protein